MSEGGEQGTSNDGNGRAQRRKRGAYVLPDLLTEIAGLVGLPAALAIAQVKGGRRAHFPGRCPDDHWLVAAAGREAADKLCQHFAVRGTGGITLLVPLGPTKLYDRARFRALELLEHGRSVSEVAREIGVATRSIEYWRAAERARLSGWRGGTSAKVPAGKIQLDRTYAPIDDGLMRRLSDVGPDVDQDGGRDDRAGDNAPPLPDIDRASLPSMLAEIARVAGIGAAVVIGRMKGGRVLHYTDHAGRGADLFGLVGRASAEKLRAYYQTKHGGDIEMLVPSCPLEASGDFDEWTLDMLTRGHSADDVAGWIGLTPAIVEHVARVALGEIKGQRAFKRTFPRALPDGVR